MLMLRAGAIFLLSSIKMQNHFKVLLLIFCFGTICLFFISGSTKKYKNVPQQAKLIGQLNNEKEENEIEESASAEQYELPRELRNKIDDEFQNRRSRVEYLCTELENSLNSTLQKVVSKLIIDTRHSLTWCPVYKSASSMWMKNFAVLSGFSTTQSSQVHKNSVDYSSIVRQKFQNSGSVDEKLEQISTTTKFMVVRHPFERLLSAYRDKLEHMQGREYYYRRYGNHITHRYRAKQSNLTSLEPSFTEFLQFIAKEKQFDEHWVPFFDSCQPCSINYDYIFKFESLANETNFFIAENNLQYYLNYSRSDRQNTSSQGITNDLVAQKYFADVPAQLLLNIFKIYELDFLFFAYKPDKYYYMTKDAYRDTHFYGE